MLPGNLIPCKSQLNFMGVHFTAIQSSFYGWIFFTLGYRDCIFFARKGHFEVWFLSYSWCILSIKQLQNAINRKGRHSCRLFSLLTQKYVSQFHEPKVVVLSWLGLMAGCILSVSKKCDIFLQAFEPHYNSNKNPEKRIIFLERQTVFPTHGSDLYFRLRGRYH